MTTLAVVYILVKPPEYLSWGTFYIQDESLLSSLNSARDRGYNFNTPSGASVEELSELFNSAAFMRAVAQRTNLESEMSADRRTVEQTLEEMRKSVWAESTGQRMIFIGSSHEDPVLAYQLAQSTMDTYVQWKINVSQHESAEAQGFFAELLETYRGELEPIRNSLTNYLIAHPEPVRGERPALESAEIERIQAELLKSEERIADAERKEENSRLALTQAESDVRQTYLIFDSPTLSAEPLSSLKGVVITFAVFVFAGIFLSMIGIAGGAFLSRSLLFPLDVQQTFNLPVLASIPEVEQPLSLPVNQLRDGQYIAQRPSQNHQGYDFTLPVESYERPLRGQNGHAPQPAQQVVHQTS